MKHLKIIISALALSGMSGASFAHLTPDIKTMIDKPHPRILLLAGEEVQIQQAIDRDETWKKLHEAILEHCETILTLPPVERKFIGRHMLHTSREALRRIFYLAYAWRMTGEEKYFSRCEEEMLAVCRFIDWNPSLFLDVSEMTMAVSIGYDWLYPELSEESRSIIRDAIVSKGLTPSLDTKAMWWLRHWNNWNQVCNAGMTYGALAVAEDHPELAQSLIPHQKQAVDVALIPESAGDSQIDFSKLVDTMAKLNREPPR